MLTLLNGAMLAFKLRLAPYLGILLGSGALAVAAVIGVLWWQKNSAERRAEELRIANDRLAGQVAAHKETIGQQEFAIRILEGTSETLARQAADLNETLAEIRHAKPDGDGAIAPVLRRTLDRLDRLRR